MELYIKPSELQEADALLKIQYNAFIDDVALYGTSPSDETMEQLLEKIKNPFYYTIFCDGKIIGGIHVSKMSESTYRIRRVYLAAAYRNKGLGGKILAFIEMEFPDAKEWTLDTPKLSVGNQHFYEKAGYQKVGETKYSEKLVLIDYVKKLAIPETER